MKPKTRNAGEAQIEDVVKTGDETGVIVQPEAWRQIMMLKASLVHLQKPHEVEVGNDHSNRSTVIDTDHLIDIMSTRSKQLIAMDAESVIRGGNKIANLLGSSIQTPTTMP